MRSLHPRCLWRPRHFITGWLMEQNASLLCACRQNSHPWSLRIILYWILNYWFLGEKTHLVSSSRESHPSAEPGGNSHEALVCWGTSAECDTGTGSRGRPKALHPQQWSNCVPMQPREEEQQAVAVLLLQHSNGRRNKKSSQVRQWIYTACVALHSLPMVLSHPSMEGCSVGICVTQHLCQQ